MLSRFRFRPATPIALLALFIALGGTSYATLRITGKNVANNSLTSTDIKNRSLLKKDFRSGQLPTGAQGSQGSQGSQGPQGVPGPANLSGLQAVESPTFSVAAGDAGSAQAFCPAGSRVVSGGGSFITGAANGIAATRANNARTGWFVIGGNTSSIDGEVSAIAYCAQAGNAVAARAGTRGRAKNEERAARQELQKKLDQGK